MAEASRIAAGLSEAQKEAMLGGWQRCGFACGAAGTLAALRRRRLTAGPGSTRDFTKLGLAVRQHLMEAG